LYRDSVERDFAPRRAIDFMALPRGKTAGLKLFQVAIF